MEYARQVKYTREDVIIWWDDERLKGKEGAACYYGATPFDAFENATLNRGCTTYIGLNSAGMEEKPFLVPGAYGVTAIVFKKEPKKKIVPFDFSLEEDREELKGRWIRSKDGDAAGSETLITSFLRGENNYWTAQYILGMRQFSTVAYGLFEDFVFVDTGKPVGKEVIDDIYSKEN